jgi:replicative DNA helicase
MIQEARRNLEESLVSAAMIRGSFAEVDLTPNELRCDSAREILKAGKMLEAEKVALDMITISAAIGQENMPMSEISRVFNVAPTSRNLPYYLEQLKKAIYEEGATTAKNKAALAMRSAADPEQVARALTAELDALARRYLPAENNDRFQQVCYDILQRLEAGKPTEGFFNCGIKTIDRILGGFCPPEYTIIAARPSIGKTAFVINLLHALACLDIPTTFFSLEMSGNPIAARLLARITGINTKWVLRDPSKISPEDKAELLKHSNALMQVSSKISLHDESGQSISTICQVARKEIKERGTRLLVVDHIQHCRGTGNDRRTEVENISSTFQDLLKELNVPGIMLSQLNRKIESENRRPNMSDLKESGAIEQNADNVVFLHKNASSVTPTGYKLSLLKEKGRNTGTESGEMYFNTQKQTFTEVAND